MALQLLYENFDRFAAFLDSFSRLDRQFIEGWLAKFTQFDMEYLISSGRVKSLRGGLYEFKIYRYPPLLVRVFFCQLENSDLLILGGYDKLKNPKARFQSQQIAKARKLMP